MSRNMGEYTKIFIEKCCRSFAMRFSFFFLLVLLSGCAGRSVTPSIALSLSGPALAIAGEYGGIALGGTMDRSCMVGVGTITLHSEQTEPAFMCEGKVNAEPSEKGRVYGILDCQGGQPIAFSLRNLGPDQGVGVGKALDGSAALMLLFYHSSTEEAKRRFPEVKAEIEEARRTQ